MILCARSRFCRFCESRLFSSRVIVNKSAGDIDRAASLKKIGKRAEIAARILHHTFHLQTKTRGTPGDLPRLLLGFLLASARTHSLSAPITIARVERFTPSNLLRSTERKRIADFRCGFRIFGVRDPARELKRKS